MITSNPPYGCDQAHHHEGINQDLLGADRDPDGTQNLHQFQNKEQLIQHLQAVARQRAVDQPLSQYPGRFT